MTDCPCPDWRTDMKNAPTEGWFLVWVPSNACGFAVYRKPDDDGFYVWGSEVERKLRDKPSCWMPRPADPPAQPAPEIVDTDDVLARIDALTGKPPQTLEEAVDETLGPLDAG